MKSQLFVGITSWNSELFLPLCLDSLFESTQGLTKNVVILDNQSDDRTIDVARRFPVRIHARRCSQAEAMNRLANMSHAQWTLLVHSDVVFLGDDWFDRCVGKFHENTALVSPEDVGCGPLTRPFGKNMPESSFMFFNTYMLRKLQRRVLVRGRWRSRYFRRELDLAGAHVTHNLPRGINCKGMDWYSMSVHWSPKENEPIFKPTGAYTVWNEELAYLRYGLGNFYSIDGKITHYHNWYDRLNLDDFCRETSESDGKGFPLSYLRQSTKRFVDEYMAGNLVLPPLDRPKREPRLVC